MGTRKAERKFIGLISYMPTILIFVIGSAISFYFFFKARNFQYDQIQKEFNIQAKNNANSIQNSIDEKIRVLRSIGFFFEASVSVEREEFSEFVNHFIKYPSVKIYGWVPRVENQNRAQFQMEARANGLDNFEIFQEDESGNWVSVAKKNVYYPLYYVVPQEASQFIGLDLLSIPEWEDAVKLGEKRNQIASTGRLEIEQMGKDYFFGLLLPVHLKKLPDNEEHSKDNIQGFVIELIKIKDLVDQAIKPASASEQNVVLLDKDATSENSYLYNNADDRVQKGKIPANPPLDLQRSFTINAGDRRWVAVFTPTAEFISLYKTSLTWTLLIIGYTCTAALIIYFAIIRQRTAFIEKMVRSKTAALNNELQERRKAQNQLLKTKQRFETLVENIPGAVLRTEVNPPWKAFYISEAVEEITGYKPSDFYEGNVTFQDFIIPADFKLVEKVVKNAIKERKPYSVEYGIYHTDKSLRFVEEKGQAVYDKIGVPLFIDGVIIDITERRLSEYKQERLHRAIEAKNKELQSIVYIASHDLKSPLVNISGFAKELNLSCGDLTEILQKKDRNQEDEQKISELLDEYIPQAVDFINAGTNKMNILINGLLQVSRAGTLEIDIKKLDMNEILRGVTESVKFQARQAGVEITIDDLPPCKADSSAVNQIFSNLVNNSLKYLSPERKGKIHIYGKVEDNVSVYYVQDNGIGIHEQFHEKIFELFHRLNPNDRAGGEGLGLTIVKRIIDRLNGSITVESEEDKGSKFILTLPKA